MVRIDKGRQKGGTLKMEALIEAAKAARERAHAPFSRFKVGAAVQDESGRLFSGCNVESASYGLSLCAERVAVFKAVSEQAGRLVRVAVVADTASPTPPCGACRQILSEFCAEEAELLLCDLAGRLTRLSISQIFPMPFVASLFVGRL